MSLSSDWVTGLMYVLLKSTMKVAYTYDYYLWFEVKLICFLSVNFLKNYDEVLTVYRKILSSCTLEFCIEYRISPDFCGVF